MGHLPAGAAVKLKAVPYGSYLHKVYVAGPDIYLGYIATSPAGKSVICTGRSGRPATFYRGFEGEQAALDALAAVLAGNEE